MRADAGAALGAAGLVLAVYFLWKNNAAGSVSSSPLSSTPTIFYSSEVEGSGGSTDRSETQGSGSGAAGVIQRPIDTSGSGTAAGIVTGAGRAPQNYAAESPGDYAAYAAYADGAGAAFMPAPKQADLSANEKQTAIKPTISGVQNGVIQGKGVTGALQATPKNEALYSGAKVVTGLGADIVNSLISPSDLIPVGTEQGKKNAADNAYLALTNPVGFVVGGVGAFGDWLGGLFK